MAADVRGGMIFALVPFFQAVSQRRTSLLIFKVLRLVFLEILGGHHAVELYVQNAQLVFQIFMPVAIY